jgi:fumarylacetoacetase
VGAFVGRSNVQGEPVGMDQAEDALFGLVLLNDWSARDIQAWEYQPLGPFLSKSFATSISPWIVTMEALAPYRRAFTRPQGDPQPLPYLDSDFNRSAGAIDLVLEVWLQTAAMRTAGTPAVRLSQSNLTDAYWTWAQMVAHHTSNGCNLRPGDLLGSGTISAPTPDGFGSLLEITQGGTQPIELASGNTRTFLDDGDEVIFRARGRRAGCASIGFGEVRGTIQPA